MCQVVGHMHFFFFFFWIKTPLIFLHLAKITKDLVVQLGIQDDLIENKPTHLKLVMIIMAMELFPPKQVSTRDKLLPRFG